MSQEESAAPDTAGVAAWLGRGIGVVALATALACGRACDLQLPRGVSCMLMLYPLVALGF